MKPQWLTSSAAASQTEPTRVLIAIDDSTHADHALRYVGTLLRTMPGSHITLFHVLRPMPRELLEHGGSEDPLVEHQLGAELQQEQEAWVRAESEVEQPILANALERLRTTGFPLHRVALSFGHDDDIAQEILHEARRGHCGTIVVSRQVSKGTGRVRGGGTIEHLVRDAAGVALWIVD